MNVIFCGGGTIGHINPAIAIAEKIREMHHDVKITFIVRQGGKENDVLKKRNEDIREINIQGLKRKITLENLNRIRTALRAVKESENLLKEIKPDCIIGTGGYVCWPVITAASKLKIPTFIHESNVYPGLVTKLLSTRCNKVFLSSEETRSYLPKRGKYSVVGNPLLKAYKVANREMARRRLGLTPKDNLIVSFGGSIGAEKLNETMVEVMKSYSQATSNVRHIHATGPRLYSDTVKKWNPTKKEGCTILPYIENMPELLSAADLVICRAGAMTITEIAAVGAPAIVIPSPHVANNHQYKNAKILSEKGAIILLEEKDLTTQNLLVKIENVLNNEPLKNALSTKIKAHRKINSTELICKEIEEFTK